ncbi:hypothetical protein MMC21_002605 [Puttea exsequens]|nr:hypothetical protein [Puttea exsequens]
MIGDSLREYIFIRLCIYFLHFLAPLSILYCTVFLLLKPDAYRIPWWLEFYCLAETLFYIIVYLPRRYSLQRAAVHPATTSRETRRDLFQLCLESVPDPQQYLSKWFKHASMSQIKRENVKEFFCWAFFNKEQYGAEDEEELEEYVDMMERLLGRSLEPGRGSATSLRLTVDSVDMLHRSLTWYLCVSVVDTLAYIRLLTHSFHFHRLRTSRFFTVFPLRPLTIFSPYRSPARTSTYWHRPHTSKSRLPVLFVHGIGVGLYPYINFLAELNQGLDDAEGEVGIIAIEIMPISSRITHPALTKNDMCEEILSILQKHGWDQVVLISHSYGTVVSTHLLRTPETASRIGPVILIDPVSFLLHVPDVAYNFTCRQPVRANEYQLWYFGSKDMGVSHTLSRRFFWSENILWKHDLDGRRVTVVLCGKDLIVDTEAVGRYLKGSSFTLKGSEEWKTESWKGADLDILWFRELDHAQVFDFKKGRERLLKATRAYCSLGY